MVQEEFCLAKHWQKWVKYDTYLCVPMLESNWLLQAYSITEHMFCEAAFKKHPEPYTFFVLTE
jgi:hypothetical protein